MKYIFYIFRFPFIQVASFLVNNFMSLSPSNPFCFEVGTTPI